MLFKLPLGAATGTLTGMIWTQGAICFIFWIALGWGMRRKNEVIYARMKGLSRRVRVLIGSVGLIGAMILLTGGLALIGMNGGVQRGQLVPWAWVLVTLLGSGFVVAQVLGAAAMITAVEEEQSLLRAQSSAKKAAPNEDQTDPIPDPSEPRSV